MPFIDTYTTLCYQTLVKQVKGLFPVLQVDLACIRRRESSSALIHIHLVKSGTVAYGRYSCTPRRTRETSSKLDLTLQFPTDLLGWHNYYPGGVSGRSNRITIAAIHTHIRPSLDFSQPKEIAALPPDAEVFYKNSWCCLVSLHMFKLLWKPVFVCEDCWSS